MNFEKPSIETLKTFIQKELKDESFEDKLIRPSEGIIVEPIYQNLENNKVNLERNTEYFTYFENFKIQGNFEIINQEILSALEQGTGGVILEFEETQNILQEDFEKLFHQIRLDYIFTVFKYLNPSSLNTFQNYLSVLKYEVPQNQLIFETFTIKNEHFYELSSQIINQISKEKQTLIEIELNGDFYWDLCKSRAFKILIDNYTKLNDFPLNYLIVTKTSSQNPHQEKVNMLIQHTTEAISGFVSATDGIIIPPIQTENINFDRRMARNIFHLLHEESYLSLVDDASNGSYFIENYTYQIAKKIHSTKI
jgi:hypothetical protein